MLVMWWASRRRNTYCRTVFVWYAIDAEKTSLRESHRHQDTFADAARHAQSISAASASIAGGPQR